MVSREAVVDALWPDFEWDASVEHMLSNVATHLRTTCRTAAGRSDLQLMDTARRGGYQLRSHVFSVDLDAFAAALRSEEHTSELQSLMRNSYAVFCLKKQ